MSKFTTQYLVCPLSSGGIDHTRLSIMARVEYCPTLLEGQCGVHGHCRISDTLPYLIIHKIPNVFYGSNRQATGGLGRVQFQETVCIFWQHMAEYCPAGLS